MFHPVVEDDLRNKRKPIRTEILPHGLIRIMSKCQAEVVPTYRILSHRNGAIIDDFARAAIEGFDTSNMKEAGPC